MYFNRLEIGNSDDIFILAPRPSIIIEKINYQPNLNNNGNCATCGDNLVKDWDIVFTIHFMGNGDLKAAINRFRLFQKFLADTVCGSSDDPAILTLQYCDEIPLTHKLDKAYMQPINFDWAPDCCDNTTISGELHMSGTETTVGVISPDPVEPTILTLTVYQP